MATSEQRVEIDGRTLRLSNLDKVLYPSTGTTKGDVIDYMHRVAPVMIPQAARRPATRKRWVDGVGTAEEPGAVFFRKDLESSAPDWVPRAGIEHSRGTSTYPLADEAAVLVWFAQVAALEVHTPQWRFDEDGAARHPDRLVLDLDPGEGAGLPECAQVALWCREILDGMGLEGYPVTSGSKGIHLYAPLDGTASAQEISEVAHRLARALEEDHPDDVVSDMKKTLRRGKVLVDWSQNNGSKTTVCPYSLRGRLRPTVAAPRTWEEIEDGDLAHLEMAEVLERVEDGLDPIAPLGLGADGADGDGAREGSGEGADAEQIRDRLEVYRSKRDPERTPEPVPAVRDATAALESEEPMFVIQEHHASRLHWDFRLEHDGVLVSWAVPKGPPLKSSVNRLAVQTEDHPLEYGTFEGTIPKGEYGGGEVTIWDAGTIEIEKWREGEEVIAVCHGREDGGLGGRPRRYAFIRTDGEDEDSRSWLLHLMKDQPAARSGRSAAPKGRPAAAEGEQDVPIGDSAGMSEAPEPMLATAGTPQDIREDEDWILEMKWDGVRAIATVTAEGVRLTSRNGHDLTATFPELAQLREAVDPEVLAAGQTVLDGEIVALDEDDRPSFSRLQRRLGLTAPRDVERARAETEVHLMLFDLLERGGTSMLRRPCTERRAALAEVITSGERVQVPPADDGTLEEAIALSRELGLEGVVAKRASSTYRPGARGRTWIKIKHERHQEVVVIGWRTGQGARTGAFGSLLLAVPDEDGTLHYVGRVGTGFRDRDLERIGAALRSRERKTPPADDVPAADRRDAHWVRADLVGEVRFSERTAEGRLRHPRWRGLREDKDASAVRWES
ncbi:ATP-dependent DNA ligase [Brachybacterium phenoliresistens]|uniref:ATP-dependent DNA ligase n=1 Tax=Brachybacterium phenoliresistens TaxID=396014 RepID=UPI0031E08DA7